VQVHTIDCATNVPYMSPVPLMDQRTLCRVEIGIQRRPVRMIVTPPGGLTDESGGHEKLQVEGWLRYVTLPQIEMLP